MIIVTASWSAKAGKEEELKKHLCNMVNEVKKKEPDCLQYTLHRSIADKSCLLFYERYKNMAAVEFHKSTPHFGELMSKTDSLISQPVDVQVMEIVAE